MTGSHPTLLLREAQRNEIFEAIEKAGLTQRGLARDFGRTSLVRGERLVSLGARMNRTPGPRTAGALASGDQVLQIEVRVKKGAGY